jgi:hypothetical protein
MNTAMDHTESISLPRRWMWPLFLSAGLVLVHRDAFARLWQNGPAHASIGTAFAAIACVACILQFIAALRSSRFEFRWNSETLEIRNGTRLVYSGKWSRVVVSRFDARRTGLNLPTRSMDFALPPRKLSEELRAFLAGLEPSAETVRAVPLKPEDRPRQSCRLRPARTPDHS